jgi:hypothetical protein
MKHQARYFVRYFTIFITLLVMVTQVHAAPVWKVVDKLTKNSETGFAADVATSRDGNTIIVSSGTEKCRVDKTCAAIYVYIRKGKTWVQQAKLTAPDEKTGSYMLDPYVGGIPSIVISADGNTVLAGITVNPNPNNDPPKTGAVYVFVRKGTQWTVQQKISLPVPSKSGVDNFGYSVAVSDDGNTAAISNPVYDINGGYGSVFIFARNNKHWNLQVRLNSKLLPPESPGAVSISGDGNRVSVGWLSDYGISPSHVNLYQKSNSTWKTAALLKPADVPSRGFGNTVALSHSGDTALIAGENKTYVFQFNKQQHNWYQQINLGSNLLSEEQEFMTVDLDDSGDSAVISKANSPAPGSSVFFYTRKYNPSIKQNSWSAQRAFLGEDNYAGLSIALSGDAKTILVNALSKLSCLNAAGQAGSCNVVYILQQQ